MAKGVEVEAKSGEQKTSSSPKQLSPCSDEPSPKHNRNVSTEEVPVGVQLLPHEASFAKIV